MPGIGDLFTGGVTCLPGVGSAIGDAVKSALHEVIGSWVAGIGKMFTDEAAFRANAVLSFANQKTATDLNKPYLVEKYTVVVGAAILLLFGIFLISVSAAALRGDPHGMAMAVFGLFKAIIGSFLALTVLQMILAGVDGLTQWLGGGKPIGQDMTGLLKAVGNQGNIFADIVFSVFVELMAWALFAVLYLRKLAIMATAAFIPAFLAGSPASMAKEWLRKPAEFLTALLLTAPAIMVVFRIGAGLATEETGPTVDQTLALMAGCLLMLGAVLSPIFLYQMFKLAPLMRTVLTGAAGGFMALSAQAPHGRGTGHGMAQTTAGLMEQVRLANTPQDGGSRGEGPPGVGRVPMVPPPAPPPMRPPATTQPVPEAARSHRRTTSTGAASVAPPATEEVTTTPLPVIGERVAERIEERQHPVPQPAESATPSSRLPKVPPRTRRVLGAKVTTSPNPIRFGQRRDEGRGGQ